MTNLLQETVQYAYDHWITLLVGLLILLFYRYCVAPFTVFKKLGIRGPTPLPFFGNAIQNSFNPNVIPKCQMEWYNKYGKIFGVYIFRQPFMVVADLDMIKEILVKEFPKFHDRKKLMKDLKKPYDRMLTIVSGQKWKDIRSTLSPTFSAAKMKQMMPFMNEAISILMQKVDRISKTGETIDFHRWLQSLTMEVILSTAFGVKAETQTVENDPITELAKKAMAPHPLVGLLFLLPFGEHILNNLQDPFDFEKILAISADIIAERTAAKDSNDVPRKDLLQLMLDAKDETGGEKIDYDDIKAQCLTFLLAGYDTSSTTLAFICYELVLHTDVQDKLRDEIDRMWPGDEESPSYDSLHNMQYLDMVINEAIRMYPPGFVLQRDCMEACTIKGLHIPKGLPVTIPCYAIHHDPEIWPEPEKFDPERFSEAEKAKRHPYAFMAFGFGPHNCVGMRFALLEIKLTLVRLLKKYKLEKTERTAVPMKFEVMFVLTCAPETVMLKISPRD
nr:cytochrome P450 3A7-like [Pocillopora verrucosa]